MCSQEGVGPVRKRGRSRRNRTASRAGGSLGLGHARDDGRTHPHAGSLSSAGRRADAHLRARLAPGQRASILEDGGMTMGDGSGFITSSFI